MRISVVEACNKGKKPPGMPQLSERTLLVGQAMYQVHEGQVRWDLQHSVEI